MELSMATKCEPPVQAATNRHHGIEGTFVEILKYLTQYLPWSHNGWDTLGTKFEN